MAEKKFKRTTVTSALPYANGGVHIGHLAGVYVPADIYVRYLRLKKEDVMFIGGSDEHGVPITVRARKEGITPQDVVDRYHKMIKDSFEEFGKTHHKFAAEWFKKLYDEGKLVEKTTAQLYDEEAKQFLADRYVVGECPHCHNEGAYGDQCEKCGRDLSPTELINPKSTISGSTPVMKETKNWYLPLNEYQDWLKQWILEGHKEWRSNVYGQCKSWLDMDLRVKCSMYGSMPLSAMYLTPLNSAKRSLRSGVLGRNGGRMRTLVWFTSSARTISCSTASSSL